jgi:DNA mismatch endonuclease (patch repair protein)
MTETPETRSAIMRLVKGRDTKLEIAVRKLIHGMGYRYRLYRQDLPGAPDLTFPGRRKVVFVHGCFWHGHDCKRGAREPKRNADYWRNKIARNRMRDARNLQQLADSGWEAMVIWECELKDEDALRDRIRYFLEMTRQGDP